MKKWRRLLGTLAVLASAALFAPQAQAADHLDAPAARGDAAADINDLFVFRSTDADATPGVDPDRTTFVMTVHPQADGTSTFSDAVAYNFHIVNSTDATERLTISCTATAGGGGGQTVSCVTIGHSTFDVVPFATAFDDVTDGGRGLAGNDEIIVFAGLRDDPFFFDLQAFQTAYQSVLDGAPDGTPLVDGVGTDFFAPLNTLAIVVDVNNADILDDVFTDTSALAVWAETVRLGNQ